MSVNDFDSGTIAIDDDSIVVSELPTVPIETTEPKTRKARATKAPANTTPMPTRTGITGETRQLCADAYGVRQGAALLAAAATSDKRGVTAEQYRRNAAALGMAPWYKLQPTARAHWQATHTSKWHGAGVVHQYAHKSSESARTRCTVRHANADAQCDSTAPNARDGAMRWLADGIAFVSPLLALDGDVIDALARGRMRHYANVLVATHGVALATVLALESFAAFAIKASDKALRP